MQMIGLNSEMPIFNPGLTLTPQAAVHTAACTFGRLS